MTSPPRSEAAGGGGYDVVLDPLWGEPPWRRSAAEPFGRARQHRPVGGRGGHAHLRPIRATPSTCSGYTNYTAGEERKAAAYARMARHAAAGEIRVEFERSGSTTCPTPGSARPTRRRKLVVVP